MHWPCILGAFMGGVFMTAVGYMIGVRCGADSVLADVADARELLAELERHGKEWNNALLHARRSDASRD